MSDLVQCTVTNEALLQTESSVRKARYRATRGKGGILLNKTFKRFFWKQTNKSTVAFKFNHKNWLGRKSIRENSRLYTTDTSLFPLCLFTLQWIVCSVLRIFTRWIMGTCTFITTLKENYKNEMLQSKIRWQISLFSFPVNCISIPQATYCTVKLSP
jgi:hypothetical protein